MKKSWLRSLGRHGLLFFSRVTGVGFRINVDVPAQENGLARAAEGSAADF
jgi:hypothetical protein